MWEADLVYPIIYFALAAIALWIYIHQICFSLLSIYTAKRHMHRTVGKLPRYPGVSIIKPLLGCDPCLRENLISHFTLDYPEFELLFCFHDENDPAIDLVNSLRAEYPSVDTRLFIGGIPGIVNPMVDNMAPAYSAAKYDLIWISSSRILVTTPIMLDMVHKSLDPNVALVHQSPFFVDHPGFLNILEKIYFGCYVSRNQIALNQLGIVCFIGMSYILKKSRLDEVGGLASYGKYLAEDFFISNRLRSLGFRIVLSDFPALQNVSTVSLSTYINRMVRWLRLRLCMIPVVAGFLEPLSEVITVGLIFALSLNYLFGIPITFVLLGHFTFFILSDYILLCSVQNSRPPFSKLTFLLAWICRELLVYWIFIKALSHPWVITWGRYSYRLRLGGLTSRLPLSVNRRQYKPPFGMNDTILANATPIVANGRLPQQSSSSVTVLCNGPTTAFPSSEKNRLLDSHYTHSIL